VGWYSAAIRPGCPVRTVTIAKAPLRKRDELIFVGPQQARHGWTVEAGPAQTAVRCICHFEHHLQRNMWRELDAPTICRLPRPITCTQERTTLNARYARLLGSTSGRMVTVSQMPQTIISVRSSIQA